MRVAVALLVLTAGSVAAADRGARRRLLDRRGDRGRDRVARPGRDPGAAAPGRLAAALLPAAARLDGAGGRRRGRHPRAVAPLRGRRRCPRHGGRRAAVGRRRRGGDRRDLPVPHVLRAGGADVHARRRPLAGGDGRVRAAPPGRPGGRADAPALHAHVGRVPVRRLRVRLARARSRSRRPATWRGGRRALPALGAEPRVPGTAHRRAVVARARRSSTSCPRSLAVAWRPRDELVLAGRRGPRRSPGWPRSSSPRGRRGTCSCSSARCCSCSRAGPRGPSPCPPRWPPPCCSPARPPPRATPARSPSASASRSGPATSWSARSPSSSRSCIATCRAGVRYLTPLGTPADPSFTDWRDALPRVRAATAQRTLIPRLRGLAPGRHVVLVTPVGRRPRAPWARAVRRRTREWRAALRADPRLRSLGAPRGPTRRASAARCEPRSSRSYADRGERGPPQRRRTASSPRASRTRAARAGRSPSARACPSARSSTT